MGIIKSTKTTALFLILLFNHYYPSAGQKSSIDEGQKQAPANSGNIQDSNDNQRQQQSSNSNLSYERHESPGQRSLQSRTNQYEKNSPVVFPNEYHDRIRAVEEDQYLRQFNDRIREQQLRQSNRLNNPRDQYPQSIYNTPSPNINNQFNYRPSVGRNPYPEAQTYEDPYQRPSSGSTNYRIPGFIKPAQNYSPTSPNPITNFGINLIKNIRTPTDRNLVVSPISAQFLLSLLEKGAEGETKKQLLNVIGETKTGDELKAILTQNAPGLSTALGIFYDDRIKLKDSYAKKVEHIAPELKGYDFYNPNSLAKKNINRWASENTGGKIQNLIPPDQDLSSVSIVLASAIYFNNLWKYKFNSTNEAQEFTTGNHLKVSLPYMELIQNIVLYEVKINGIDCTFISLPYQNEKYEMVLIVPDQPINLDTLVENISPGQLDEMLSTTQEKFKRFTKLQMPRFSLKSQESLVDPLKKMKLVDVFGSQSDLSGITDSSNLFVSEILQQATLDVDENGTVAAAATSALLIPLSADSRPRPRLFVINKPFISIILDTEYNSPLFISKVNNPIQI